MDTTKNIPVDERIELLYTICTKRNCSWNISEETGRIIQNTGRQFGSQAAEAKAKELRELIETDITEEELLKKLKAM